MFIFRNADIFSLRDLVSPAAEPPRIFRHAVLLWMFDVASQNDGIQSALGRPFLHPILKQPLHVQWFQMEQS